MDIFNFLIANWEAIIAALFALHGVALAIVNITSTPEDDRWVGQAYKVIEVLAGIGRKAKELPGEADDPFADD